MSYEFAKVDRKGRVAIITMNRPEVMNALHSAAHSELHHIFNDFAGDPEQWVAIVTDDTRLDTACPLLHFQDTMWLQLLASLAWDQARIISD